jgi:alkanesulfonate monooxygenase SsuD/methylene tetrahydromethanopterin reductase-like flavin-dependent oxidoreductase (luciferase family)
VRLGVSIPPAGAGLRRLPEFARRAEELGYQDAWSYEGVALDGFTPVALASTTTRQMRLGIAIVPVFLRPPGLLAMSAAAMSVAAPGRFVLGLGASTRVIVEDWMGVPFEKPLERTVQTARMVRALLGGERVGAFRLAVVPESPPAIWLAALGPKILAAAHEVADGVCFFLVGPKLLPQLLGAARGLDSMARVIAYPGRREDALPVARRALVPYALSPGYQPVLRRQGFAAEVDAIAAKWSGGERAEAPGQVSDAMVEELVLMGDMDDIRARVADYAAAGLGAMAIQANSDAEALLDALAP